MAVAQVPSTSLSLPRGGAGTLSRPRTSNAMAWLPLASVLVGIISLFYLAQTSELATTGYNIQQLQLEEARWQLINEQLTLEAANARSLAAVEAQATGRMLMIRPKQIVYLRVADAKPSARAATTSRGDRQLTPALAKNDAPSGSGDLMESVRGSISMMLSPYLQQSRNP